MIADLGSPTRKTHKRKFVRRIVKSIWGYNSDVYMELIGVAVSHCVLSGALIRSATFLVVA